MTVATPNKGYPLLATGDQDGIWGITINDDVFSVIDNNLAGRQSVSLTTGTTTLSASEAENFIYTLSGSLSGDCTVAWPAAGGGAYIVKNGCTMNGHIITLKATGGTGVTIPASSTMFIYVNPSTTVTQDVLNYLTSLSLGTALPIASGGTAATTALAARAALGLAIGSDVQGYSDTLAALAGGTYTGATSITTLGTIATGTWDGTAVGLTYGGTGASSAAGARTNLGLGTSATVDTGTSGTKIPLLDAHNTWSGQQDFTYPTPNFIAGSGQTGMLIKNTAGANQTLIQFNNNSGQIAQVVINSSNNGVDYQQSSDARLKENIRNITEAMNVKDIIYALRPVQFTWINNGYVDTGYIAQEYEKVFPDQVSESKDGMKMINAMRMPEPVVIAALQEMCDEIHALQERIRSLELTRG